MVKHYNIFVELLKSLKVKYTISHALKVYLEHPHRNDLYGLSAMLTIYGIENVAIQLDEKKMISEIETPFVAHANNEFVLVKRIENNEINYLWHDKWITIPLDKFMHIWSGVLLLAEANEISVEPNYYINRKKELVDVILSKLLFLFSFIGGLLVFIISGIWSSLSSILIGLQLIGIFICCLLLQKQLKMQSSYGDRLCSLFNKSDCNNVLESDVAKVFGIFSWSEIGLGYFISTLLICMIFPRWIPYCAWIGVLALPYTFWSIWYQYFKVKQWCPMCLIVMGIIWLMFVVYVFSGNMRIISFDPITLLGICLFYLLPFFIIHKLMPIFSDAFLKQQLVYEVNNIKLNEKVFLIMLKENQHYDVSIETSRILFGNPKAKILITVLTNPHCEPCAKVHQRIENLLYKTNDRFCVQYIFSSFDKSLQVSNKMLIAAYFREGKTKVIELYNNWFEVGKYYKEEFFEQNNLSSGYLVEEEWTRHQVWIEKNKLHVTPTILINGYELPEQYKIEDLALLNI